MKLQEFFLDYESQQLNYYKELTNRKNLSQDQINIIQNDIYTYNQILNHPGFYKFAYRHNKWRKLHDKDIIQIDSICSDIHKYNKTINQDLLISKEYLDLLHNVLDHYIKQELLDENNYPTLRSCKTKDDILISIANNFYDRIGIKRDFSFIEKVLNKNNIIFYTPSFFTSKNNSITIVKNSFYDKGNNKPITFCKLNYDIRDYSNIIFNTVNSLQIYYSNNYTDPFNLKDIGSKYLSDLFISLNILESERNKFNLIINDQMCCLAKRIYYYIKYRPEEKNSNITILGIQELINIIISKMLLETKPFDKNTINYLITEMPKQNIPNYESLGISYDDIFQYVKKK